MNHSLATPLHRALFALPLLAVSLAGFASAPPSPQAELPRLFGIEAEGGNSACQAAIRPTGALALARMPGDIGPPGFRLRCAG